MMITYIVFKNYYIGYFMPLLDSGEMTGNKGERVAAKVPGQIGATNIVIHTRRPNP